MTEKSDFRQAFKVFMDMPYPDYPRIEELRDWNSRLLDLDGHIAGYATLVNDERMQAAEVPEIGALALEVESLRQDLDSVRPGESEGARLVDDYRSYVRALERLVRELAQLVL